MTGWDLEGQVIRPPAEAGSLLVQVTLGCSYNKCAFCPAYKGKRFAVKDRMRIRAALGYAAARASDVRRVFLCDGDALVMPQERLEETLADIHAVLPQVARISCYASAKAIASKSDAGLVRLRRLGLGTLHLGLESGSDAVLASMQKWGDVTEHLRQAARAKAAGFRLVVTVLLGLAGGDPAAAEAHARATGRALTRMAPEQAAALALMIVPGTPLFERLRHGEFLPQSDMGLLRELRLILEETEFSHGLFLANHASNPLPLRLRLPRDKARGLALIDAALHGGTALVPPEFRGL